MVKDIDKRKDDYDYERVNGDEEQDVEVGGEETRAMGVNFSVEN